MATLNIKNLPDPLYASLKVRAETQHRSVAGVRTPDALQLAAALAEGCTAFVTNDRRLPSLPGLRILQLGDYD